MTLNVISHKKLCLYCSLLWQRVRVSTSLSLSLSLSLKTQFYSSLFDTYRSFFTSHVLMFSPSGSSRSRVWLSDVRCFYFCHRAWNDFRTHWEFTVENQNRTTVVIAVGWQCNILSLDRLSQGPQVQDMFRSWKSFHGLFESSFRPLICVASVLAYRPARLNKHIMS